MHYLAVYWAIVGSSFTFGSDLHLLCNITCCNDKKSTATSISSNMLSKDFSKYEILTSNQGCRLVIKHFGPKDANVNYTCSYNFQRYSRNLTLDDQSFECKY